MATYATHDDVRKRWPKESLEPEIQELVEERLKDVERKIVKRIPDLATKVLSGEIDPQDVIYVECESVLRLARNPEGYVQESDGNYSYMLSTANSGKLTIEDDEWEMLGIYRSGIGFLTPKIRMPR